MSFPSLVGQFECLTLGCFQGSLSPAAVSAEPQLMADVMVLGWGGDMSVSVSWISFLRKYRAKKKLAPDTVPKSGAGHGPGGGETSPKSGAGSPDFFSVHASCQNCWQVPQCRHMPDFHTEIW